MADSFTLTVQGEQALLRRFRALPEKIQNRVGLRAMRDAAMLLERHIKGKLKAGNPLRVRSDRLRASVTHTVQRTGEGFEARVGPHVVYARLHEYGGVVSAKNAKFLTIPLRDAMTPAGVARFTARKLIENPSAFGYDATFFSKGVLLGVKGRKASSLSVPLFALKRSVRIPARPYLRPALAEKRDEIIDTVLGAVRAAVAEPSA